MAKVARQVSCRVTTPHGSIRSVPRKEQSVRIILSLFTDEERRLSVRRSDNCKQGFIIVEQTGRIQMMKEDILMQGGEIVSEPGSTFSRTSGGVIYQ